MTQRQFQYKIMIPFGVFQKVNENNLVDKILLDLDNIKMLMLKDHKNWVNLQKTKESKILKSLVKLTFTMKFSQKLIKI